MGHGLRGLGDGGLGLGAKLFYAAVIVAACVGFVKTRKGQTAAFR